MATFMIQPVSGRYLSFDEREEIALLRAQEKGVRAIAVRIRGRFAAYERREYGREWSLGDLLAGLATDVGDLSRLVTAKQGLRPAPDDLDAALAHEVADRLWAIMVIAAHVGVDVPKAFEDGMSDLDAWLDGAQ